MDAASRLSIGRTTRRRHAHRHHRHGWRHPRPRDRRETSLLGRGDDGLSRPDRPAEPGGERHRLPGRPGRPPAPGGRQGRTAGEGRGGGTAARLPDRGEGSRRDPRHPHHQGLADLQGLRAGSRFDHGRAPEVRRRHPDRQDQRARVRLGLAYAEPGVRADPQPLRPLAHARRLQRRGGRRAGAPHASGGRRQRLWRLAPQPGRLEQRLRLPPLDRAGACRRRRTLAAHDGHGGADGPHGAGPGDAAGRAVRLRPPLAAVDRRGPGRLHPAAAADFKGTRIAFLGDFGVTCPTGQGC